MLRRQHGGDIYGKVIDYDFSVNLNPLGLPEGVKDCLRQSVETWNGYPDPGCRALQQALGDFYQVRPDWMICSNGAAELLFLLVQAKAPKRALVLAPSFSEYEQALRSVNCQVTYFPVLEKDGFYPRWEDLKACVTGDLDLVFFCNPNNPTGIAVSSGQIEELAEICRQQSVLLVLDECFCEFLEEPKDYSFLPFLGRYPNVFLLKAFTKLYAMAGLRLGFGICSQPKLLDRLSELGQPWNVSLPAQQAGVAALKETQYVNQARGLISTERKLLKEGLTKLGLTVYGSEANYIFFRDGRSRQEEDLGSALLRRRILIRDCGNYQGLCQGYYRIGIKIPQENQILLKEIGRILKKEQGECHELI